MPTIGVHNQNAETATLNTRRSAWCLSYRLVLPVALWVVFVNVASHYQTRDAGADAAMQDAVVAELASRRCTGLRLDPASFREMARERGISHADLYQRRSARLQKVADHVERRLRADPDVECERIFGLYGGTGPTPHLLSRI